MVQLVEVIKNTRNYELREVFVNPRHVVMLRDNGTTGSQFVVVGSPGIVESKLKSGRQLLNG